MLNNSLPPASADDADALSAIINLAEEAVAYVRTLPGEGIDEVSRLLAASTARPPRFLPPKPMEHLVDLHAALEALAEGGFASLAEAIRHAAPHLRWITYDLYPRAEIGERFAEGHCFASLAGSYSPFLADDFDFGLFLIRPNVLYRDHNHAAPELYAPLTGPHGWRFEPGATFEWQAAHTPVWNPPHRPHATLTGVTPFLGFYGWTRDVDVPAKVIRSEDWNEIESGLEA